MANAYNQVNCEEVVINPSHSVGFVPVLYPHLSFLVRMDVHRSNSLLQFMCDEGLMPSLEDKIKRELVICKLKEIVQAWIKKVAWQRKLPENVIRDASATILTYGSYGLGVHNSESDIDALCVAPWFSTMAEDFFIVLYNILKGKPEVKEIYRVEHAKVPLMRFKFDGIAIDLPYAQLQVMSVPEDVDLLNPMFLTSIDETSWKSLSGVRVNQCILQLVPNLENFQSLLRCIKFWAKRRGVYGNLFGFFGGIHLAILSALICQRNSDACLSSLVMSFFNTYASWPWPTPVVLQGGMMHTLEDVVERRSLMPIRLPCNPYHYCQSNITRSTFNRIRAEFLRGQNLAKDILKPDFEWNTLFDPYINQYRKSYSRFLKISLLAGATNGATDELGNWVGWVKSRFPSLILKLEEIRVTCDPNPTEYVDTSNVESSVVFYWGLNLSRFVDFNVFTIEREFWNNINNGYQGTLGNMELSIVPPQELPSIAESSTRRVREMKAGWRLPDYGDQRMPVYSRHAPTYFIGYLANTRDYARFGV